MRQPIERLRVSGDPSIQRFVKSPRILGVDSRRMLVNSGQLPVKGFSRQKVFELSRLGSEILTDIRLSAEKGPGGLQRIARPIKIPQARLRQRLVKLGRTLDCILDRPMRRIERRDRIVLRPAQDRLHLPDGAFEDRSAWKP